MGLFDDIADVYTGAKQVKDVAPSSQLVIQGNPTQGITQSQASSVKQAIESNKEQRERNEDRGYTPPTQDQQVAQQITQQKQKQKEDETKKKGQQKQQMVGQNGGGQQQIPMHQPSRADVGHMGSTNISQLQANESGPNFNSMYAGPNNPMPDALTPGPGHQMQEAFSEPMAANAMGGAPWSSF